jgi:K(+)-stimulated pyrophosphate-energized sodium pump
LVELPTALFGAFRTSVQDALAQAGHAAAGFSLSVDQPNTLVGLIIGAAAVFLFASLAIMAVGRAASKVVAEVRDQFHQPGIMEGTRLPDYARVVDICTRDALRELATPALLAVMAPIATGFALGYSPLGGYLAGAIAAGTLMAIFLATSGAAWDNAKKLVESGQFGGKGTPAHAATITGDTVGDPFKDTAGPAINPLIKVMNLVALLIAPSVVTYAGDVWLRALVAALAAVILIAALVAGKRRARTEIAAGQAPVSREEIGV